MTYQDQVVLPSCRWRYVVDFGDDDRYVRTYVFRGRRKSENYTDYTELSVDSGGIPTKNSVVPTKVLASWGIDHMKSGMDGSCWADGVRVRRLFVREKNDAIRVPSGTIANAHSLHLSETQV